MLVWLSGLPSKFSNKELADEVKAGLCGIENCINEVRLVFFGNAVVQCVSLVIQMGGSFDKLPRIISRQYSLPLRVIIQGQPIL